ncbi:MULTISPECIES: helix-turn-helix transcriptional regulator [Nocardiaceae]|uniref:Transcriptional regulator with XRE-family HTH domain n=1 Tax=Rhodococcoides corynebacterioides TaxID=53972 RepID=A0ABS2KN62_9NOCA|nr:MULTISPECIES: helix-turn-helix transcriptional regulator [Rhodococcus]MBM7413408.1 transcriptional regulator with XRE-family HTH domain [Rhodococcus corynebacterioides]MBP1115871.1 transcriptional regulator with XRE-family HTH domain [Rhodococcus sp. PvP016]
MTTDRDSAARRELGAFLRARRSALPRSRLGLPPVPRGRSTGLRREDVSSLSHVSVTWYTWLEQGRDIHPSRQVLDAIAATLHLTPAEHDYVLDLAGHPPTPTPSSAETTPPAVQRLLDALTDFPAFALRPEWTIAGWNRAYRALFPRIETVEAADRNLLWLVFTDPYVRELLPHWETDSRRFLAEFRADGGAALGTAAFTDLVDRLRRASGTFADGWDNRDIEGFASRERVFRHPVVGELRFEHHQLAPTDHKDLNIVVYLPVAGTDTREKVQRLIGE